MFSIFRRRERGQVLLLFAVAIPILLGMTGMAIDIGSYATERRDLQNAADAASLAAAQELPDAGAAEAAAHAWGLKNDIDVADMDVSVTGGTTAPRVRVVIERSHEFAFMPILGIDEKDVSGAASAVKVSYGGGSGVVPWSVTEDTLNWATTQPPGTEVTLKFGADNGEVGNYGVIAIDGTGASVYEEAVEFGSDSAMCAIGTENCPVGSCTGDYPDACAETAEECDGALCEPETGNISGKTKSAVEYRLDHTKDECDTFGETFSGPDADGEYDLDPDCNPWASGGACPDPETDPPAECSRQVIIIPVIDQFGSGSSDPVTVMEFALFFLTGLSCESDTGNGNGNGNSGTGGQGHCEVQGIFVRADVTTNGLAGVYDEEASIQFVRLDE